ncbi:ParA family protein [Limosilactobacillus reuteri]|uniref:ParA family protein n=1 Tax=Limosilactobacillus reuteri TaxID=1598 RepID=A0AAX2SS03_LIMRT|nr:ParA family protein [Limosilactobacillus reuteri]
MDLEQKIGAKIMETKVISFCNQKGGVGKTSTTALVAYNLSKMGYKSLVIDLDPQANMTSLLLKTKSKNDDEIEVIDNTLMNAIKKNENLEKTVIEIAKDFYLIPNAVDFSLYGRYLENNFKSEQDKVGFLSKLINRDLRGKYDFIFIDVPPTLSLQNDTAYYACDDIIIVLQTQQHSLDGAEDLVEYIQTTIIDEFDSDVVVIGVLPVLSKKGAAVDKVILEKAKEMWGDDVFKNHIRLMERVKRMDITGITDGPHDVWDQRAQNKYKEVAKELVKKIGVEE